MSRSLFYVDSHCRQSCRFFEDGKTVSACCTENCGNKIDGGIQGFFYSLGAFVGSKPRQTIGMAILFTVVCGAGFVRFETESRGEELWVPQDTRAEQETLMYESYFNSSTRFNTMIVQAANPGGDVLTKEILLESMLMHSEIATKQAKLDGIDYGLLQLCSLVELDQRLTGLSTVPPFIAEPVSEDAYRNVMAGLFNFLSTSGSNDIGNVTLGGDNWPTTEADFVATVAAFASSSGPGSIYDRDVTFSQDGSQIEAFRVELEYVRLTKENRGELIDDAARQIDAMDSTRDMVNSWDDLPTAFAYSSKFITIEGFKIIQLELFQIVGLAIAAVGVIVCSPFPVQ
ncbi:predicted protein [Phaeodactylum tricornutum CCAP 1055/1]|uniref:Uncharacterized protein n=2 Tax=Phaeodactylum tricornutum TaxID=2850 RepID=B7FU33_PHATC|nr:predicted protein [Phaeodactylum tricornutum CCAP 1055/1]EEC49912.1 predicted protein [Phaeodactylum tricornutum CCAP 1055/1]|eukprot:XP_002178247.1 predicted protein [Phaeodactylum tricornutum CCAP 1055/1]